MFTNPGYSKDLKLVDPTENIKCQICVAYKPVRALHCNLCNKCVLRIENHCVWVNNCIGYYNFKACLLLSFYLSICGTYYVLTGIYIVFIERCGKKIFGSILYGIYLFTGIFYLLLNVITVNFFVQTTIQLIYGVTGVERAKNSEPRSNCFSCEWIEEITNLPYDIGWIANFERMFDKGGWYSLWPFTNYKDLGFDFDKIPPYPKPQSIDDIDNGKDYLEEATRRYGDANIQYDGLLEINSLS